jgi:hypothetical protein
MTAVVQNHVEWAELVDHLLQEGDVRLASDANVHSPRRLVELPSGCIDVDADDCRLPDHEWAGRFTGEPTNNTLYFWDGLIEQLRFPFLKTVLPRQNQPWHDSMAHLRNFIERHTDYPYELIQSNLDRLGCGPSSRVKPAAIEP